MRYDFYRLVFFLFCLSAKCTLFGQTNILDLPINLPPGNYSLKQVIEFSSEYNDLIYSYSSNFVDIRAEASLDQHTTLREFLEKTLNDQSVEIRLSGKKRILFIPLKDESLELTGYVIDSDSGEKLEGVIIRVINSQKYTITNNQGFFTLKCPKVSTLDFSYLGYKSLTKSFLPEKNSFVYVPMKFNNEIQVVTINPDSFAIDRYTGGERIKVHLNRPVPSLFGSENLTNHIKLKTGVSTPDEGSGGYSVRGGSQDQNLILFEGAPMYEVNHIGGLNTIFINDAIREVDFLKGSFPSRYGGRVSSVLDIQLKDGNKYAHGGSVSLGILGPEANFQGPILYDKMTFNVSARTSWVDLYAKEFFDRFFENDNTGINYHDVNAKLSFDISKTSNLSISIYDGDDAIRFVTSESSQDGEDRFELQERNSINWGNRLYTGNFKWILGSRVSGHIHGSYLNYEYQSRGTYDFNLFQDQERFNQQLDVWAYSGIRDINLSSHFDFYASDQLKFNFGLGTSYHRYNPTLRQSRVIVQETEDIFFEGDSTIRANENYAYAEVNYELNNWSLKIGSRLNHYQVRSKDYVNFEPRISLRKNWTDGISLSMGYSQMSQFVHRLVNPGTGLPSDLWVPSTQTIKPQNGFLTNVQLDKKFESGFTFSIGGYWKEMRNLLDYQSNSDIFFNVINTDDTPVFGSNNEWENRVISGKGRAYGAEFASYFNNDKWDVELNYTLSRSTRTFEGINDNEPFPDKYERLHDLKFRLSHRFNNQLSLTSIWYFSSGSNFSLALEEFATLTDEFPINSSQRNNISFPYYHRLDLGMNYTKNMDDFGFEVSGGVYNSYNRFNPFYVYIYDDPIVSRKSVKGVSLFPVLPYLNVKMKF